MKSVNEPLRIDAEVKNGPLDLTGGGERLDSLKSVKTEPELESIMSLRETYKRLMKDRDNLGMPKDSDNPLKCKRKRCVLNKKAKEIDKKIKAINVKTIDTTPEELEGDITKFTNLAEIVGYPSHNLKQMPRQRLELEKLNILEKANKHFKNPAKTVASLIVKFSHCTDGYESVAGYSSDLKENQEALEIQVKKYLISEGMESRDFSSFTDSPYVGIAIVMGLPLMGRYMMNRALIKQGKSPVTISRGKSDSAIKKKKEVPIKINVKP